MTNLKIFEQLLIGYIVVLVRFHNIGQSIICLDAEIVSFHIFSNDPCKFFLK